MSEEPRDAATPGRRTELKILNQPALSFAEAMVSPCGTCESAPCCRYVPLHNFQVQTLRELDHARYLLNFDRIELGLSSAGRWTVYYRSRCRFLDPETSRCTIYTSPERPRICEHYNPYGCWYRRALTGPGDEEFLRIDGRRLEAITAHVLFDERRDVLAVPDWASLLDIVASIEPEPPTEADPPAEDAALSALEGILAGRATPPDQGTWSYDEKHDPCTGCGAFCCRTLIFPFRAPQARVNVDYLKFVLGFPGIELGIADQGWSIVVHTTCRHLKDNRCAIYGRPERPLICRFYDAWHCQYKVHFGLPRPQGFLRVRLEQFRWLVEAIRFDEHGDVIELPATDSLRAHVEQRWSEALRRS
jgi:Fe-S-cluster containining protein